MPSKAERTVRERHPDATVDGPYYEDAALVEPRYRILYGKGGRALGRGLSSDAAWRDAASRLPPTEGEG